MTESITISGETFNVDMPYAEGHTLTVNEAAALNQVRAENLRNNFAAKVKEAKEAGSFDLEALQKTFSDYAEGYEFGVRRGGGGGRTSDPVMAEAMSIAREKVKAAVVKQGHKLSDVSAAQLTEFAKAAIEKNPAILELARTRVAEAAEIAEIELGDVNEPANEMASAATSGRKGKNAPADSSAT